MVAVLFLPLRDINQAPMQEAALLARIRALETENADLHSKLETLNGEQASALEALRRILSERERDLRSILDNMPVMIGYWDTEMRNRFGNHAYMTWFGVDPDTMPGKHIREVIGEERFQLNLPYIEKALQGEPQTFERAIPTPDGRQVRHSLAHYIPDILNGVVQGFYVLVSDISAQKEYQARLLESEERYRAVVEEQTEVISRLRPDGTFTFVNEVYCRFFGKPEAALINDRWQPIAHPDDLPLIERELQKLCPENPVVIIENRVYSGSGALHWMQFVNRGFFDASGQLQEIQSVGRDITARKQAELALQESHANLEQRIRKRTEQLRQMAVAATLAEERERQAIARDLHDDLGQLLHVIKLKLELLSKNLPEGTRPAVLELDQLILQASQQVRSLMTQLSPPILTNLGLAAALRWLGSEMEKHYQLAVHFALDEQALGLAPHQSALLFRVARELLINVAKHSGTRQAWVKLHRQPEGLRLTVEDAGQGISAVEEALASHTGFGLQSVRERILFLGGSMEIQNCPTGGLAVHIQMPLPAATSNGTEP